MPAGVVDALNNDDSGLPSGVYVESEAKGLVFVGDCWVGVAGVPFSVEKSVGAGVIGTPKGCPELPFEARAGAISSVFDVVLPKACSTGGNGTDLAEGNRDFGCLILNEKPK